MRHQRSAYQRKDARKFSSCTQLISRGSANSSSRQYQEKGLGAIKYTHVNTGLYYERAVVGISVNGARGKREKFDEKLVQLAMDANCMIVTDTPAHRTRSYNIGERELAQFLADKGYVEDEINVYRSVWRPNPRLETKNRSKEIMSKTDVEFAIAVKFNKLMKG